MKSAFVSYEELSISRRVYPPRPNYWLLKISPSVASSICILIRLFIYFSAFSFYYKFKKSSARNNLWNIGGEITFFASLKVKPNSKATKTSRFCVLVRIYRSQFKQKAWLKNHFPGYAWKGTRFSAFFFGCREYGLKRCTQAKKRKKKSVQWSVL